MLVIGDGLSRADSRSLLSDWPPQHGGPVRLLKCACHPTQLDHKAWEFERCVSRVRLPCRSLRFSCYRWQRAPRVRVARPSPVLPTSAIPPNRLRNRKPAENLNAGSSLATLDPCSILDTSDVAMYGPVENPSTKRLGLPRLHAHGIRTGAALVTCLRPPSQFARMVASGT